MPDESSERQQPIRLAAGFLLMTRGPGKFLLLRHVDRWDLPKGHCEPGETMLQCALRETAEETGLAPERIDVEPGFVHAVEYVVDSPKYGKSLKRLEMFLGWVEEEFDPTLTEHVGYQWFDWKAPHAIQARAIDPLLADADEYLRANER